MPPPLPLVVGRRDPPVLLSLLLSAAVRTGHVGKMTLLNIPKRQPFTGGSGWRSSAYALALWSPGPLTT
jgi:hypothetical protein